MSLTWQNSSHQNSAGLHQLPVQHHDVTCSCIFTPSPSSRPCPRDWGGEWVTGQASAASGEGDFPSLCVRAQFTGADDQHPRGVHAVQSHLRVQTEPRDQVLQVSPRLLPPLEEKRVQRENKWNSETVHWTVQSLLLMWTNVHLDFLVSYRNAAAKQWLKWTSYQGAAGGRRECWDPRSLETSLKRSSVMLCRAAVSLRHNVQRNTNLQEDLVSHAVKELNVLRWILKGPRESRMNVETKKTLTPPTETKWWKQNQQILQVSKAG